MFKTDFDAKNDKKAQDRLEKSWKLKEPDIIYNMIEPMQRHRQPKEHFFDDEKLCFCNKAR